MPSLSSQKRTMSTAQCWIWYRAIRGSVRSQGRMEPATVHGAEREKREDTFSRAEILGQMKPHPRSTPPANRAIKPASVPLIRRAGM